MADSDFDRIVVFAGKLARLANKWDPIERAFRRDVTSFYWRTNGLLEALGISHRTYAGKFHVPGRVMLANEAEDSPDTAACEAFLESGGTIIVEGKEMLDVLGIKATARALPGSGAQPVKGPDIVGKPLRSQFWLDDKTKAIRIKGAEVRVAGPKGPYVSQIEHGGGTIVVFSTPLTHYSRESTSTETVSPRALAVELDVEMPEAGDIDKKFPRDLFVAQLAMMSVLGDVIARAL